MSLAPKVFRSKSDAESAEIANTAISKVRKNAAKKVDAAETALEIASANAETEIATTKTAAKYQALTQASVALASDAGMEALFVKVKGAENWEAPIAGGVVVVAGVGAALMEGYAQGAALGVATAAGGRLARMGMRKLLG